MLRQLRIENVVLARDVLLELAPGLNLITGETGGGKSLMVNALALAMGGRGDAGLVRQGTDRAVVEALFDLGARPDLIQRFARAGFEPMGDEALIRREISADGRSRAFLNGATATLALLKELTAELVELHGQHEPQTLLQSETHRAILDQFGRHEPLLERVRRAAAGIREVRVRLAELTERASARTSRVDLLEFRLSEFDHVNPVAGEDDELKRQRERLRHAEAITEALSGALELIYEGEQAAVDHVHAAARRLRAQAEHDPDFDDLADRLDEIRTQLSELAADIRSGAEDIEPDGDRLAEIEDRLHALERLRRRFDGAALADVITRAGEMRRELEELDSQSESETELQQECERLLGEYRQAAGELSAARHAAAARLSEHVNGLLGELAMDKARLLVSLSSADVGRIGADAASMTGVDEVELMLQANPGEPARALRKIASGGELSRVMLALDVALESGLPRRTLLFDEVDQGLGGQAADRLGDFLCRVAGHHQVICITHLPQVAARGDLHVTVSKKVKSGRTVAVVKTLEDEDQRVEEIARMLGGSFITDTARSHAEQLMRQDEQRRKAGSRRSRTGS